MASTQNQPSNSDENFEAPPRTGTIDEATVHHVGEAYSKQRPVPTIPRFIRHQQERAEESKRQEAELADRRKAREDAAKKEPGADQKDGQKPAVVKPPKDARTSDVPIGDDKTNVLYHPPPEVDMNDIFVAIHNHTLQAAYISAAAIVLFDVFIIGGGFVGFLKSLLPAGGVGYLIFYVLTQVVESAQSASMVKSEPAVERMKYVPESVEWVNSLLDTVWQVVSEDVFKQVAQQVEDQVKAVIPFDFIKFKVAEIGHGTRPIRILSMRSLPDSEFGELVAAHGDTKGMSQEEIKVQEEKAKKELGGIFYNLEVSLAYHAEALGGHKKRMHFDIIVLVGGVPIPIFVETREFVMTVRVRLQLNPDLPFLKHVTFALNEPPKVVASVAIGHGGAFNLLSLPLLDGFIISQIAANTTELCRPKSMSIDMTPILGGNDAITETDAVGLLYLKLHRAENLRRQDRTGPGADPYITVSFSKYEKPMYATKMIIGDLNPVWEETTCILINAEHVKRQESLLVKLWDSDRNGKDDVTGQVEVPLVDLIKDYEKVHTREDALQHEVAGADTQGILYWEVGFFPEAKFDRSLLNMEEAKKIDTMITDKTKPEDVELTPLNCRPDPEYPTGILSVTIYQCINIEVPNPRPKKKEAGADDVQQTLPETKDAEGLKTSDSEEESEEGRIEGYLPSVYCTADINDEFAFRTRTKSITKSPIYNSTVERYITDWRNIVVSVAARDVRRKGRDFLIGAVTLKATDIFKNSSAVSDWYDFVGGNGSGRVRVALLFRSTTLKLQKHELGWNVGRFEFCGGSINMKKIQAGKLKLKTCGGVKTLMPSSPETKDTFEVPDRLMRVPVFNRYLAPLIFQFYNASGDRKASYYSIIWLHNLIDNETRDFDLTIYQTDKPKRFTQNCIEGTPDKHCKVTPVGSVHFKGRFRSGMCPEFKDYLNDQDEEDTFEVWEVMDRLGHRDVHEADTGSGHPDPITGTDNLRDPTTTQAENIMNGGTGRYGDKEARNVNSENTGTLSEPALSGEEVQERIGRRPDLMPPSEWEMHHGKGATEAPFADPDMLPEHPPAAPLVNLAKATAPPLARPQDIEILSHEDFVKREATVASQTPRTPTKPIPSPTSVTSSKKPQSPYVVRSMLDVPDVAEGTEGGTAEGGSNSHAVPRNASFNIDRPDDREFARRQSLGSTAHSDDLSSVHDSPNPNYFVSSSAGMSKGENKVHDEELQRQADMIPRLPDVYNDTVPRSVDAEREALGGDRKNATAMADKMRETVPGNALLASAQLLSLTPGALGQLKIDLDKPDTFKTAAKTVVKSLVQDYTGQKPLTAGILPSKYGFFESGLFFNTLIDYAAWTGDNTYNTYFEKDFFNQVGDGDNFMPANVTATLTNGDVGYWALAAMSAAEYGANPADSSSPSYLTLAKNVFENFASRWDTKTCKGGLRDSILVANNGYNIKDAESNGAFFELAARLGLNTGNKTYLDWATKIYDWTNSTGFISQIENANGGQIYFSATVADNCEQIDKTHSSALQSNYIYGAAVMYNATKSKTWLDRAVFLTGYSAVTYFTPQTYMDTGSSQVATEQACEFNNTCTTSQKAEKSVMFRSFGAAITLDQSATIRNRISIQMNNSATAAAKSCTSNGDCGFNWSKLTYNATEGTGVGEKMNAVQCFLAILRIANPVANKQVFGSSPATQPSSTQTPGPAPTENPSATSSGLTPSGNPNAASIQTASGFLSALTLASFMYLLF
ncbi:Tricalbin-1 [Drechslerella dactyloides]|uniref:Tricalbin-1 n=1 Tax=Drechslerella dactyloides TaxID=74499 RepID=A0AAD6J6D4_DREDA|nr:Tricalbin-1 [Drechslerella dactyloides]